MRLGTRVWLLTAIPALPSIAIRLEVSMYGIFVGNAVRSKLGNKPFKFADSPAILD